MSIDPIQLAKVKTLAKKVQSTTTTLPSVGTNQVATANAVIDSVNKQLENLDRLNQLKELPIQPDPELLKKEAMARAQTLRSDAETMLQQRKEEEINKLKEKAEALIPPALIKAAGLLPVLPILDPKILAWLAYQKIKQEIKNLKQKASKENIKRSKEAFTFPMKPPKRLELGNISQLEVPKIPEIPRIDLPKIG